MKFPFFTQRSGMTLIEMVIYIAFLSAIAGFAANIIIQISNTYFEARAEREVLSNARLLIQTISGTVSSASEIYAPTSRFNTDAGQLSLITTLNPQSEHTAKYVDFWLDNGKLLMREEGSATTTVSAATVQVDQFKLERITQGLNREAVKLTLRISYPSAKFAVSTILNNMTALRGNY